MSRFADYCRKKLRDFIAEPVRENKVNDDVTIVSKKHAPSSIFSTHIAQDESLAQALISVEDAKTQLKTRNIKRSAAQDIKRSTQYAMDSINLDNIKTPSTYDDLTLTVQLNWYGQQGFIGYMACAIMAQHWLVYNACNLPAEDATRNGYDLTINDGTHVDPKVLAEIRRLDIKFKIREHLEDYITYNRIFGTRLAYFKIDSDDPLFYEKPFNLDGVKPGSYKGIIQIDPNWCSPELDFLSGTDPTSANYYKPVFWRVNNKLFHHSHLIIAKHAKVADILKPSYYYGGISLTQQIYEAVYAAERTANEAPQLAQTKRLGVQNMNLQAEGLNMDEIQARLRQQAIFRDNYGLKVIGEADTYQQLDTSLAEFPALIDSGYGRVSAVAKVPENRLMMKQAEGMNSSGSYEESSYDISLKTIQSKDASPLVSRHHQILVRSHIMPTFNIPVFEIEHQWRPNFSVTPVEKQTIATSRATESNLLVQMGALDGEDVRRDLVSNPNSGWNGLTDELPTDAVNTDIKTDDNSTSSDTSEEH